MATNAVEGPGKQYTPVFASISAAGNGNNTLVAADATRKIRVLALHITPILAVTVQFQSGAGGTNLTGVISLGITTSLVLPYNEAGWFETATNTLLNLSLGGATQTSGSLTYILV